MVPKIPGCLPRVWRDKVTTIQKAKDVNTLGLDTFIGSLKPMRLSLLKQMRMS